MTEQTKTFTEDEFNDALLAFMEGAQKKVDAYDEEMWALCADEEFRRQQKVTLTINPKSKRYIGIFAPRAVDTGNGRIYAFIDTTNGDVLKPASWRAPAKHARGNIFSADNGVGCVNHYGPNYLR